MLLHDKAPVFGLDAPRCEPASLGGAVFALALQERPKNLQLRVQTAGKDILIRLRPLIHQRVYCTILASMTFRRYDGTLGGCSARDRQRFLQTCVQIAPGEILKCCWFSVLVQAKIKSFLICTARASSTSYIRYPLSLYTISR